MSKLLQAPGLLLLLGIRGANRIRCLQARFAIGTNQCPSIRLASIAAIDCSARLEQIIQTAVRDLKDATPCFRATVDSLKLLLLEQRLELFPYAVFLTSTGLLQVEVLDLRLHQSLLLLSRDLLLVNI